MYSTYKKLKKIHKELCKIADQAAIERAMKDHGMYDDDMMDDDMEMSALRRQRRRRKALRERAALQMPRGRRPLSRMSRRGRDLDSIRARLATLR